MPIDRIVLEALAGVEDFVAREVATLLPEAALVAQVATEVVIDLPASDLARMRTLRTPVAAYLDLTFAIQRPKALLATENVNRLAAAIARIRGLRPRMPFSSFRFSAAGSDSAEFARLADEIARTTDLIHDAVDGDLLIRVRRIRPELGTGWEVLLRLTPRPLSTRAWRVANYPGAVNATIAAAMVDAIGHGPHDQVIDLMCGSGTLVLERLSRGMPDRLVGCDLSAVAVEAAQTNQRAAQMRGKVEWWHRDALALDHSAGRFTHLMANPPWGELVGDHDDNDRLYAGLLATAARIAASRAILGVLTHDIRRFERILASESSWHLTESLRFFQKGHHPRLYLLQRRG